MQRLLQISLIAYFPLLGSAAAALLLDFRPESLGSPLFRLLFWLWLFAGLASLMTGLLAAERILRSGFSREEGAAGDFLLAGLGILLGIPPVYIMVELGLKMVQFFSAGL